MKRHNQVAAFLSALGWLAGFLPAPGLAEDITIVSAPAGDCTLSIEASEEWKSLRLRAQHPRYSPCRTGQDAVLDILEKAFAKIEASSRPGAYESLSFGRMIDFPWLSHFLAETAGRDKRWNRKKGRPFGMDINAYAARVLFDQKMLQPIQAVLGRHGYRIDGVSVEKVLVGSSRDLPDPPPPPQPGGLFPFDAQLWFHLTRR